MEKESCNLVGALRDLKAEVTLLAKGLAVPFSNDQTEADLRMVKLQQKISGSFRAAEGPQRLGKVRSYISTAARQGAATLDTLTVLFAEAPRMPPAPARTYRRCRCHASRYPSLLQLTGRIVTGVNGCKRTRPDPPSVAVPFDNG